jgi:hypothetical protein
MRLNGAGFEEFKDFADESPFGLPHPNKKVTDLISKKLMQYKLADVPNLAKLITSFIKPDDCIKYHTDIPDIKEILHNRESYTSGIFENHSGILLINLEYKCNCYNGSRVRSINTLLRGTYIPRMYFDRNGDLIIDTFTSIRLPKSRVAVMATATGVTCVPARVLSWSFYSNKRERSEFFVDE